MTLAASPDDRREKVLILSMLKSNGRFLLGTGQHGQLFEVDEATKERTEIARLDHGQIHCLKRRRDGSIVVPWEMFAGVLPTKSGAPVAVLSGDGLAEFGEEFGASSAASGPVFQ